MSEQTQKKAPSFYEIAAKIAAFCDEVDKKQAKKEVAELVSDK